MVPFSSNTTRIPLAAAVAVAASPDFPADAAGSAVRSSIALPGGVAALQAALDATRPFDRASVLADTTRMAYENPPGDSGATDVPRRKLLAHIASLRSRDVGPADTIPLPLAPSVWASAILQQRVTNNDLALAILESREAALVHVGLSALDDETLAYLETDRATLERIVKQDAALFAAFGRSLRIHNGRVVVPGGDGARALWETVAGSSPNEPGVFLLSLLDSPGGRLAFLYDTAAHLDSPAQRFLLGLDLPDEVRAARFTELAHVFTVAYPRPPDRIVEVVGARLLDGTSERSERLDRATRRFVVAQRPLRSG